MYREKNEHSENLKRQKFEKKRYPASVCKTKDQMGSPVLRVLPRAGGDTTSARRINQQNGGRKKQTHGPAKKSPRSKISEKTAGTRDCNRPTVSERKNNKKGARHNYWKRGG